MSIKASDSLPFTGWECPSCGYFTDDPDWTVAHRCGGVEEIAGDPVVTFLNRWHWRGDRSAVEKELRELLAASGKD